MDLWYKTTFFLFNHFSRPRFLEPDFLNQISKNCKKWGRRIKGCMADEWRHRPTLLFLYLHCLAVHMIKKDETCLFPNAIWEKCKWKVQMFILVTLWQLLPCHFNAWCVAKAMEYVGLTYLPLLCNPLSYYIFWLLMYIVCNWASTCTIHKDSEVLQKD